MQLGAASVIPMEQAAPSQRAVALQSSLESWVLGPSICTGAFSAMQPNVLFFLWTMQ